jgi:hypothetical protein
MWLAINRPTASVTEAAAVAQVNVQAQKPTANRRQMYRRTKFITGEQVHKNKRRIAVMTDLRGENIVT